jgi:hypothetical protein
MHDKTGKIFKEKFVHQMGKSLKFTSSCGSLKACRAGHVHFLGCALALSRSWGKLFALALSRSWGKLFALALSRFFIALNKTIFSGLNNAN